MPGPLAPSTFIGGLPIPPVGEMYGDFGPTLLEGPLRDGTIKLTGNLNRAIGCIIRFDGKVNSPTRGQFFVTAFARASGARQPERPMTLAELEGLKVAVTAYQRKTPGYQPDYQAFNALVRKAIAEKLRPPLDIAAIPTEIVGPNGNARVEGSIWVSRFPGPGPAPTSANASIDVLGNGFNDAPPRYRVTKLEIYEQGTNRLVASLANPPLASTSILGRGTKVENYATQIPLANLQPRKKYAAVMTVGINGATPKQVRSEFLDVGSAF